MKRLKRPREMPRSSSRDGSVSLSTSHPPPPPPPSSHPAPLPPPQLRHLSAATPDKQTFLPTATSLHIAGPFTQVHAGVQRSGMRWGLGGRRVSGEGGHIKEAL